MAVSRTHLRNSRAMVACRREDESGKETHWACCFSPSYELSKKNMNITADSQATVVIVAQNIRCEEGPLQVHRFDHIAGEGARCNTHLRFAAGPETTTCLRQPVWLRPVGLRSDLSQRQRVRVAMGLTARHLCGTWPRTRLLKDRPSRPQGANPNPTPRTLADSKSALGTFVFSSALGQDVKLRPRQAEFCHLITSQAQGL